VHGVRSIDPSRRPGHPARLGVPGYRMGLSVSRRADPAARKVTKVATSPITTQVVSVPSCPELWRDANRDSATTSVPVADAAKWIRDAVFAKFTNTSPAERATTIVVLDAGLAGILSAHEVADAYLGLHGDPHLEFGLASIWLVGPTPSTTTRIGTGRL
jgi:hypothetical protein